MDTSLLQQPLSSKAALEWLEDTLGHSEDEDDWTDPDEALSAILEYDWQSEEEFLEFFKEISIQLAKTATRSVNKETAELYGTALTSRLSLGSPYYALWEKAFRSQSPILHEEISLQSWDTCLDASIESLNAINLLPLAFAYEEPLREVLRYCAIDAVSPEQEEFLGYFATMLSSAFYDGDFPLEIINIPSAKVLSEILEDWTAFEDLWEPLTIRTILMSEHANRLVKDTIARVLNGESEYAPEAWENHVEEYWDSDDIEEILQLCE